MKLLLSLLCLSFISCNGNVHTFDKKNWNVTCVKETKKLKSFCVSCLSDLILPRAYARTSVAVNAAAISASSAAIAASMNSERQRRETCADEIKKYEVVCIEYKVIAKQRE